MNRCQKRRCGRQAQAHIPLRDVAVDFLRDDVSPRNVEHLWLNEAAEGAERN